MDKLKTMNSKVLIIIITKIFLLFTTLTSWGQLVTSEPAFPTVEDNIIITFNAQEGSGGLAGYTGDVYAHTGVITENSNSSSDWKYVKTDWG